MNTDSDIDDGKPVERASKEARAKASDRRKFIVEYVRTYRRLPLELLLEKFSGLARQSLLDDIRALNDYGIQITRQGNYLIDERAPHTEASEYRLEVNRPDKLVVAALAHDVVVGYSGKPEITHGAEMRMGSGVSASVLPESQENQKHRAQLEEHLGRLVYSTHDLSRMITGRPEDVNRVMSKMRSLWQQDTRMVAIDSGTTNEILAQKLALSAGKATAAPEFSRHSNLVRLTVVTNSRLVFETLGQPAIPIRTIIIGGSQRGRTSTIAGALAEYFLKGAALLNFGVSIIGATNVATQTGVAFSDSQEEAVLKDIMFEKSFLRVLAVDDSKLTAVSLRGGYSFGALDPNFLDLIVVNSPLALEHGSADARDRQQRIDDFPRRIKDITDRGIPVIVGRHGFAHYNNGIA